MKFHSAILLFIAFMLPLTILAQDNLPPIQLDRPNSYLALGISYRFKALK